MSFSTPIASTSQFGNGNTTTSAIDTTGADFLIVCLSYLTSSAPALSDSKSNSWTGLTISSSVSGSTKIFYSVPTSVGSGHTFTATTGNFFGTISAAAFSGALQSGPFDQENGANNSSTTTLATGSVTPSVANELIIASPMCTNGRTFTIDSSFSITTQANGGASDFSGGIAYLIQTSASAVNPTWTQSGSAAQMAAAIATFKAAGGGASVTYPELERGIRGLNRGLYPGAY